MKILLAALLIGALAGQVIRPDGVTKTTREHRVDLSACDEVIIKVPLRDAHVSYGEFTLYAWKKYGVHVDITCSMEATK